MRRILTILATVSFLCTAATADDQPQLVWPVKYGRITSNYGPRRDPFNPHRIQFHNGIDIACAYRSPVNPVAPGMVYSSGYHRGGYGNLVVVYHQQWNVYSFYGHNDRVLVKPGQYVDQNTTIALAGSTGRSTGVHVHFGWIPGAAGGNTDNMKHEDEAPPAATPPAGVGTPVATAGGDNAQGWVDTQISWHKQQGWQGK